MKDEHERLKEELHRAQMESDAKTKFLFNMSHDIRTPLNAVMGFLYMAEKNIDNREMLVDSLKKMKAAGRQLSELIDGILELSRLEAGQLEIIKKPFSISVVGTEQEIVLIPAMEAKKIFFEATVKNISDMYVISDKTHISQIIYNVMSNAVKYTRPNGTIKYCFEQIEDDEKGRARFKWTISDNGIGMSEEFQKHIFERFSRERNTTESGIEGTGLGMSLVKELLQLMDGEIEVISRKDNGTTVSFVIPMERSDVKSVNETMIASGEELAVSLKDRRILVVEDNAMNRDMLIELLVLEGIKAEGVADGADVTSKLEEHGLDYYDAILMDLQMPYMDGYQATRVIREVCGRVHIPIIGLSANTYPEDIKRAFEAGMDNYLSKPVNIMLLKNELKRHIMLREKGKLIEDI